MHRGRDGRGDRARDDEPRRHRADVLQSGDRGPREGPPGARDRRPRRHHGENGRPGRDPVQDAEPGARSRGVVTARAGRQGALSRDRARAPRAHARVDSAPGAGRRVPRLGRAASRRPTRERRRAGVRGRHRDARDVPERAHARRRPHDRGRSRGRSALARPVRVPRGPGLSRAAPEDRSRETIPRAPSLISPARSTWTRSCATSRTRRPRRTI